MGFRFRKSLKIAPGVKLNFNKKSTGITLGGKGFHYTKNSKGKHTTTASIPGTGLSYTSSGSGKSSQKTSDSKTTNNSYSSTANQYSSNVSSKIENGTDFSTKIKKLKRIFLPVAIIILLLIIGIASCGGDGDDEAAIITSQSTTLFDDGIPWDNLTETNADSDNEIFIENETTEETTSEMTEKSTTEKQTVKATEKKIEKQTKKPVEKTTKTQTTKSISQQTYILNTNTKKFHEPSCSSCKKIAEDNKESFTGDRADLIAKGYAPCGNCRP